MANVFDLNKRTETLNFVLEKHNVTQTPKMRVGAAFDISGSARPLYTSGVMQSTIDRLIPVGMRFDDNGEMDVWAFDDAFSQLPSVSQHDYEDYIQRAILDSPLEKWGATQYAGPMRSMLQFYFGGTAAVVAPAKSQGFLGNLFGGGKVPPAEKVPVSSDTTTPAMALFITDGANSDREAAKRVLMESRDKPMYWQLIGVGNPREFKFLQEMADLLPNVGMVHLSSLELSDDELYNKLFTSELAAFIKKHAK